MENDFLIKIDDLEAEIEELKYEIEMKDNLIMEMGGDPIWAMDERD